MELKEKLNPVGNRAKGLCLCGKHLAATPPVPLFLSSVYSCSCLKNYC